MVSTPAFLATTMVQSLEPVVLLEELPISTDRQLVLTLLQVLDRLALD